MNIIRFYPVMIIMLLGGCGGGDDSGGPTPVPPIPPVSSYKVFADDNVATLPINQEGHVDLSSFSSSSAGRKVQLTSIELLSGGEPCYAVQKGDTGFHLSSEQISSCVFKYTVTDSYNNADAISRVVFKKSGDIFDDSKLIPRSLTMEVNQQQDINLVEAGLTLTERIVLLGDGEIVSDVQANTITYTSYSTPGVARILYEMENDEGDIYLGSVDVAVSQEVNIAPVVQNFSYPESPMVIKAGDNVKIDIRKYISDPDGNPLWIHHIHSFDGVVKNAGLQIDKTTEIDFLSATPGDFYIGYTITDGNGGFATGMAKVTVVNFFDDIKINEQLVFSAPLSFSQTKVVGFSAFSKVDTEVSSGNSDVIFESALFNFKNATDLCAAKRGRLPTIDELQQLNNSGKTKKYWPGDEYYYSSSHVSAGDKYYTLGLGTVNSGLQGEASSSEPKYVTCVLDGSIGGVGYHIDIPSSLLVNSAHPFSIIYWGDDGLRKTFNGTISVAGATGALTVRNLGAGNYVLDASNKRGSYNVTFALAKAGDPLNGIKIVRSIAVYERNTIGFWGSSIAVNNTPHFSRSFHFLGDETIYTVSGPVIHRFGRLSDYVGTNPGGTSPSKSLPLTSDLRSISVTMGDYTEADQPVVVQLCFTYSSSTVCSGGTASATVTNKVTTSRAIAPGERISDIAVYMDSIDSSFIKGLAIVTQIN